MIARFGTERSWRAAKCRSIDELPTRAEQDQAQAFQLYRLAPEQGIAGPQCRLGVMYAEGRVLGPYRVLEKLGKGGPG